MREFSPPSYFIRTPNNRQKEETSTDAKSRSLENIIVLYEVSKHQTSNEISVCDQTENRKKHSTNTRRKFAFYIIKTLLAMYVITQVLVLLGIIILAIRARPEGKTFERSETMVSVDIKELAKNYNRKVNKEGACSRPVAKLISVSQSLDKIYKPHCAILHRCSNDTGCCHSDKKICAESKTENVTLPFKVKELLITGDWSESHVFLTFVNHTECKCKSLIG